MKPERVSQLLFLVATSVALLVYCLSAPSTLPWGHEARMAAEMDVRIYTPNHPMDYLERRKPLDRYSPVTIGEDCWIGGGTVIRPGVTIGNRVIAAAGSVVVDDVPDDVMVAGNPARVKRRSDEVL